MEVRNNEAGGQSVVLFAGDNLRKVPRSHRHLLTPPVRGALADPAAHFRQVADRCRFEAMARWLRALLAEGRWRLELHLGYDGQSEAAGFYWSADAVRSAMVAPAAGADLTTYPPVLRHYFSLVNTVDWMGFGAGGNLSGADNHHHPLTAHRLDYHGAAVDLDSTFVWGTSSSGNLLIYTADGRGGWVNLGSHQVQLLGTIGDTIDWLYSELLAGRGPEWQHTRWNGDRT